MHRITRARNLNLPPVACVIPEGRRVALVRRRVPAGSGPDPVVVRGRDVRCGQEQAKGNHKRANTIRPQNSCNSHRNSPCCNAVTFEPSPSHQVSPPSTDRRRPKPSSRSFPPSSKGTVAGAPTSHSAANGPRPLHTDSAPECAHLSPTPISIPHESGECKSKPMRNSERGMRNERQTETATDLNAENAEGTERTRRTQRILLKANGNGETRSTLAGRRGDRSLRSLSGDSASGLRAPRVAARHFLAAGFFLRGGFGSRTGKFGLSVRAAVKSSSIFLTTSGWSAAMFFVSPRSFERS